MMKCCGVRWDGMGWSVWAERGKHPRARMGEVQRLAEGAMLRFGFLILPDLSLGDKGGPRLGVRN